MTHKKKIQLTSGLYLAFPPSSSYTISSMLFSDNVAPLVHNRYYPNFWKKKSFDFGENDTTT